MRRAGFALIFVLAGCVSLQNNRPDDWIMRNASASGGDFQTDDAACTDKANQEINHYQGAIVQRKVWNVNYYNCMVSKGWTHR